MAKVTISIDHDEICKIVRDVLTDEDFRGGPMQRQYPPAVVVAMTDATTGVAYALSLPDGPHGEARRLEGAGSLLLDLAARLAALEATVHPDRADITLDGIGADRAAEILERRGKATRHRQAGERCSDPPALSCADAGCRVHGWDREDDELGDGADG